MKWGRVGLAAAVLAVAAGALLSLWLLTGTPAPQEPVIPLSPQPQESAPAVLDARVLKVVGSVERQHADEQWAPVQAGERLGLDEELRTGPDASADLAIGTDSTIRVASDSRLAVVEITRTVQRVNLKRGRLAVEHTSDGTRRLRIEDEQGRAVVADSAATFDVQRSGESFGVATTTGRVNLAAAGRRITVEAGRQALAHGDKPPTPATAIPARLLLKVARATQHTNNEKLCAVIAGTAPAGGRVLVQGTETAVGADGTFRVSIPRAPGQRQAVLVIEDMLGRRQEQKVACARVLRRVKDMSIKWGTRGNRAGKARWGQ